MITKEQAQELQDFIFGLNIELQPVDAMQAAIQYRKQTGNHVDWHVFSDILDLLHRRGFLALTGHRTDGMREYTIAPF